MQIHPRKRSRDLIHGPSVFDGPQRYTLYIWYFHSYNVYKFSRFYETYFTLGLIFDILNNLQSNINIPNEEQRDV